MKVENEERKKIDNRPKRAIRNQEREQDKNVRKIETNLIVFILFFLSLFINMSFFFTLFLVLNNHLRWL